MLLPLIWKKIWCTTIALFGTTLILIFIWDKFNWKWFIDSKKRWEMFTIRTGSQLPVKTCLKYSWSNHVTLGFTSNPALVWLVIYLSLFEMHFVLLLNINICRVWIHSNTWNICAFTSISRRFVWIFFFRLYTSFNRKCSWSFTATTKPVEINQKYCSNALHFLYKRENKKNKNKLLCYILRLMTN